MQPDQRGKGRHRRGIARFQLGEGLRILRHRRCDEHLGAQRSRVFEGRPVVLFVDYLQKIASQTPHTAEAARSFEEVEGLKELALDQKVVVVAIAAAEVEGLKAQRLRLHHLLASAGIAYEADIIVLMNEKFDIIDRRHLEYNRHQAAQYHQYVVLSVEKNRVGTDLVDLEIRKQLQFCHFRTDARRVEEHLISGRGGE